MMVMKSSMGFGVLVLELVSYLVCIFCLVFGLVWLWLLFGP